MNRDTFMKCGVVLTLILLSLNLGTALSSHLAAETNAESRKPVRYKVMRVDSATNQETLFEKAGQENLELAGTIEVAGNTGYLIFRK